MAQTTNMYRQEARKPFPGLAQPSASRVPPEVLSHKKHLDGTRIQELDCYCFGKVVPIQAAWLGTRCDVLCTGVESRLRSLSQLYRPFANIA